MPGIREACLHVENEGRFVHDVSISQAGWGMLGFELNHWSSGCKCNNTTEVLSELTVDHVERMGSVLAANIGK